VAAPGLQAFSRGSEDRNPTIDPPFTIGRLSRFVESVKADTCCQPAPRGKPSPAASAEMTLHFPQRWH